MSKTASHIILIGSFTLVVSIVIASIFWGDLLGYFALGFGIGSIGFLVYGILKKAAESTYIRTSTLDESENIYKTHHFSGTDDGFEIIKKGDAEVAKKPDEIPSINDTTDFVEAPEIIQAIIPPKKTTIKPPDLLSRYLEIAHPVRFGNAREDFEKHLLTQLNLIKELFGAYTCAYFVADLESRQFSLFTSVSNSADIQKIKKMELEDDILSKIILSGEPNLLTIISPVSERDAIRYYSEVQGIRSFVGVPVFYEGKVIAVVVVDSKEHDVFGYETIYQLGHFAHGLSAIYELHDRKKGPEDTAKKFNSLLTVLEPLTKFVSFEEFLSFCEKNIFNTISWDAYIFVAHDDLTKQYFTYRVHNRSAVRYIGQNFEVAMHGTLVGKAITDKSIINVDNTGEKQVLRYSNKEELGYTGSFIVLPIMFRDTVFGALCFEALNTHNFKKENIQYLKSIASLISFVINTFESITSLQSNITIDISTKFLKKEEFMSRLSVELLKSKDIGKPGALYLIQIDDLSEQESFFGNEILNKAMETLSGLVRKEITYNEIVGKIDEKTLAVFSYNNEASTRYVWAEKLRKSVARSVFAVGEQNINITVSIGIYTPEGKDGFETDVNIVFENAILLLKKAAEKRNALVY